MPPWCMCRCRSLLGKLPGCGGAGRAPGAREGSGAERLDSFSESGSCGLRYIPSGNPGSEAMLVPCWGVLISWLHCNSTEAASVTQNQRLLLVTELQPTQPASAKWYDRRDYVFIEFCVEDSKDVNVNFEKSKLTFSCLGGSDNFKHLNEIDLFNNIDPNESKHKRTDRSILCCLRKGESGQAWPRLTKERAKLNWLSVDFNNWKDWEDDSDEDMSNFDRFSEMMNNMGGDDDVDLPEVDGADDDSPDSDDEKMPDLE
ncbi:prostaglandin E synthase 3 isoform X1 [Falco rusticolus]|uniref:prostaglandin E synthase 3 isoform X1 n=1 Tax=Falco rusticolus TaxID=120794 RepID=UPI0018867772|nr:prostaglandin E synthase 3 isoform X1 [Falco rusticolus]